MKFIFNILTLIMVGMAFNGASYGADKLVVHVVTKDSVLKDSEQGLSVKVGDLVAVEVENPEVSGQLAVSSDLLGEQIGDGYQSIPSYEGRLFLIHKAMTTGEAQDGLIIAQWADLALHGVTISLAVKAKNKK